MNILNVGIKYDSSQTSQEGDLSDSMFLSRLIEILTTSSPDLQTKAASTLEFLTAFETCREKIISLDIESALDSFFRQKFFNGNESRRLFINIQIKKIDVGLLIMSKVLSSNHILLVAVVSDKFGSV